LNFAIAINVSVVEVYIILFYHSVDLLLAKKYLLQMVEKDDINFNNADVNGDGEVQANDVLLIKKYVLTMIDSFN
jgi:hypothetical protein